MRGLIIFSLILLAVGVYLASPNLSNHRAEVIVLENNLQKSASSTVTTKEPKIEEKIKEDAAKNVIKTKGVPLLPTIRPTPKPTLTPNPTPSLAPRIKSSEIYNLATRAVLNLLCYDYKADSYILGSAAIIHPDGYVLTNGHLAEHLADPQTQCILRRGSPATNFAKAKIVWLPDQTKKIGTTEIPENDIAILKITELLDGSPIQSFDYFKIDPLYVVAPYQTLYSLNYPTEFLGAETAIKNANLVFSLGTVESMVSVDDDTSNAEGAYLKGEVSVQHGSSGGIFLDYDRGEIVGIFVGLTEGKTTSERKQFIFLSSYLDKIARKEKGMGLLDFLNAKP